VISAGVADGSTPIGSVGKPLRDVEVRLDTNGELLVRGPNVMRGYWKDPGRTSEVLRDGWYATGDLSTIDADGNIRLIGRAKDLIVLPSGMKVWPQDVEDVLRSDHAVKDAAVIAVRSPGGGATLHAYLIPIDAAARLTDVTTLVARCNGHLAQHQRIASASWWHESDFPRTSTLKLRRNLLPPPNRQEAQTIAPELASDDPIGQAVTGVAHLSSVRSDQTLAALGLDSLGLVDLALALEEKTGKAVADGDLRLDMTVEEVRSWMASKREIDSSTDTEGPSEAERGLVDQPVWPYAWGRRLRFLSFPFDLLYRLRITRTIVLGTDHLANLPTNAIFAGTHRSVVDTPLVRFALASSPGRDLARRMIVAMASETFPRNAVPALYVRLAYGVYSLQRRADRDASLRELVRLARELRAPVLIYPQGTYSDPRREELDDPSVRFRPGVAHLAAAMETAVVPFGLAGPERILSPLVGRTSGPRVVGLAPVWPARGPLAIAFGVPLRIEPGESPHAFTQRLQQSCYLLSRQAEQALEPGASPDNVQAREVR
jgi:long-chain acyl-CoA synthetase